MEFADPFMMDSPPADYEDDDNWNKLIIQQWFRTQDDDNENITLKQNIPKI